MTTIEHTPTDDEMTEREFADVHRQLTACREERDKLRNTHQQVIAWMRQTDGAMPMGDVIKILERDLEAKP